MSSSISSGPGDVWYKSTNRGYHPADGWQTYKRLKQEADTCKVDTEATFQEVAVDIVRETPLVAVLRNFITPQECSTLIKAGGDWESMGRAYTSTGSHSNYRRSYSSNIDPDLDRPEDDITQMTARMFAATRNLTGYKVFCPGQEPINAVLYKVLGDEYRPHCDGDCHNNQYRMGERVATSIIYCHVPESGGATSFTKDSLKVVPGFGDMLLFSYYLGDGDMAGTEAEHSGCPLRAGKKWIGTQWYREGVHDDWNWEAANGDMQGHVR